MAESDEGGTTTDGEPPAMNQRQRGTRDGNGLTPASNVGRAAVEEHRRAGISPISPAGAAEAAGSPDPAEVFESWLGGRAETTRRAYLSDMVQFARWYLQVEPRAAEERTAAAGRALAHFLTLDAGRANLVVRDWMSAMLAAGLAPATTHRRIATLSSFTRFGRMVGAVTWTFDVDRPRSEPYRDTSGPGLAMVGRMAAVLAEQGDGPMARRDRAIFALAATAGLRRGEIAGLLIGDVDLDQERVRIVGKGRRERTWHGVGFLTRDALAAWLTARATTETTAPLFVGFTRSGSQRTNAISTDGIYKLIRSLGSAAGAATPVRPHGLRHTAITTVADREGVVVAQQLSRHRKLDTLQLYLDNTDRARAAAETMSDALAEAHRAAAGTTAGQRRDDSGEGADAGGAAAGSAADGSDRRAGLKLG